MNIYKVWEYHIPSEIFDFYNKKSVNGFDIKLKNDYVVFISSDKKELSLNTSSTKATYQIDSIRYSSEMKDAGNYKITSFKQIGGDASYVVHKGTFDKDQIIAVLFGLSITDKNNNTVEFSYKQAGDDLIFDISSPVETTITFHKDGSVDIDGTSSTDKLDYKNDTLEVKVVTDNKSTYNTASSLPPSVKLTDSDESEYYLEYDIDNEVLIKKALQCDDDPMTDNYGAVLNKYSDVGLAANMLSFYLLDEDKYLDRSEYAIANYNNGKICSTQISRIISNLVDVEDNIAMHDYGFFKTSGRVYPSYAYVGSSFAYIKYSRAKASLEPCTLNDDTSDELALYFKVRKNKGVEIKQDKTAKTVLKYSDADFANNLLKYLRKGFGAFSDPLFTLKRYTDDGSHIKVLYNYQNSKSNYQVDVYDETMRYKVIETRRVNGDTDTKTYYYRMYKSNAEMELRNTKAKLNMFKKVQIDFISDAALAANYVSSVSLDPFSVLERSNAIIVNPNNFGISIPKSKISLSLFGMTALLVDSKQVVYNILYQNTSDTIYVFDTANNKNVDIKDFTKLFNNECDNYKLESACSYSILEYKTLNNKTLQVEFPVSTLFLIELVNGPKGIYYRIYYKNAEDIGTVEAISHKIIDI